MSYGHSAVLCLFFVFFAGLMKTEFYRHIHLWFLSMWLYPLTLCFVALLLFLAQLNPYQATFYFVVCRCCCFFTSQFIKPSRSLEEEKIFLLSLLRLDIDFALLHNASMPLWEASRLLRENLELSHVTGNHLTTPSSDHYCQEWLFGGKKVLLHKKVQKPLSFTQFQLFRSSNPWIWVICLFKQTDNNMFHQWLIWITSF